MVTKVKLMVWKRWRRHDGTNDFDVRAHDRRVLKSESAARCSKISSMISCGTLGVVVALVSTGVGSSASEVTESIRGVGRRRGWWD